MTPVQAFDPYKGADPRGIPVYGIAEAAHYLSMPENTVRSWVCGRTYPGRTGQRRSTALVRPADVRVAIGDRIPHFFLEGIDLFSHFGGQPYGA